MVVAEIETQVKEWPKWATKISKNPWQRFAITHRRKQNATGVTWMMFLNMAIVPFLDFKGNLTIWMQPGKFFYFQSFIKKCFSKTHDVCYAIEAAKRTNRHRCDNNLGHNLIMSCKYVINSKGLTFDQCLRKARMVTVGCKMMCFLGFEMTKNQCKIV